MKFRNGTLNLTDTLQNCSQLEKELFIDQMARVLLRVNLCEHRCGSWDSTV
jgi:hypothetical protein